MIRKVPLGMALLYVIVACVGHLAFAWVAFDLFIPKPPGYHRGAEILELPVDEHTFIAARYLANPSAHYTFLYSHGNAEDIGLMLPFLERLRDMGFSVFAYDYEGYGTSGGRPSEKSIYRDIDAAYLYLTNVLKVPPNRIIIFGRSLGTGPSVDLAARKPAGGLVLQSPFLSIYRAALRLPLLPFDKFRNIEKIAKARLPLLVIHGTEDAIVPFFNGDILFDAASEPKIFLKLPLGHNFSLEEAGPIFEAKLHELEALIQGSPEFR